MTVKSISEVRTETRLIVNRLAKLAHDETVSYDELASICGVDKNSQRFRGWLASARRITEREHQGIWLEAVHSVGIKRLTPSSQPESLQMKCSRVSKLAGKALHRSAKIEYDAMSDQEKVAVNTTRTILHVMKQAGTKKVQKNLLSAVQNSGAELPMAKALEHFQK